MCAKSGLPVFAVLVFLLAVLVPGLAGQTNYPKTGVINYGSSAGQDLWVDCPGQIGPTTDSVILIHGGGWHWGDRQEYSRTATALVQAGFLVYNMNYRLGTWPKYLGIEPKLDDIASVVAIARQRSHDFGASGRIHLTGASAGGHLALLFAYGRGRGQISRVVSWFGPADLANGFYQNQTGKNDLREIIATLMGAPLTESSRGTYLRYSPLWQVVGGESPTLLIHGTADPIVPWQDSKSLSDALTAKGSIQKLISISGGNHGGNWGQADWEQCLAETIKWFSARDGRVD